MSEQKKPGIEFIDASETLGEEGKAALESWTPEKVARVRAAMIELVKNMSGETLEGLLESQAAGAPLPEEFVEAFEKIKDIKKD